MVNPCYNYNTDVNKMWSRTYTVLRANFLWQYGFKKTAAYCVKDRKKYYSSCLSVLVVDNFCSNRTNRLGKTIRKKP